MSTSPEPTTNGPDPSPTSVDVDREVESTLSRSWGRPLRVRSLGSMQDAVYRVLDADREPVGAARVSTGAVDPAEVDAEALCLAHLARALPDLDLPTLVPTADGELVARHAQSSIRLMTWVRGARLGAWSRLPDQAARELGALAARVSGALEGFDAAALHREVEWDPRLAVPVVERYLPRCPADLVDDVRAALDRLRSSLPPADSSALPGQVVHLDLTDLNVLGTFDERSRFTATGIVDFEDTTHTWSLCELAVTAHAVIARRPSDPVGALRHALDGYLEHAGLTETEADLLWELVLARAAICAVVEAVESQAQPDNDYARRSAELDARALRAVLAVHPGFAREVVRHAAGLPPVGIGAGPLDPTTVHPLLREPVTSAYQVPADLTDEERDARVPDAMTLGARVRVGAGAVVSAPWDAEVAAVVDVSVTLRSRDPEATATYLRVDGVVTDRAPGAELAGGDAFGQAAGDDGTEATLHVQLLDDPSLPSRGAVRDADVWASLCPDPRFLLPEAPSEGQAPARVGALADRRRQHVASVQKLYYATPPEIVSGRGQWLVDRTGRRYLDMVNNVAVAGHSHPRITAAAAAQMAILSTNSRFLYDAIADYADKIVATLPPELDSVVLVNSGSEAVEVALQMARAHTGRHDVVVLDGTYHGWTTELGELITVEADRPGWRDHVAPWVHVADAPDVYRGRFGDDTAAYVDSLRRACEAAAGRGGAAAFVHEPVFGTRGGVVPPEGYLEAAYATVREAGGVVVADEVQVGFARTGRSFWSFQAQGVVPDVVASAKAAGNGHPLGFVACRREIAESYAQRSVFFSTAGGNPVSCRIGEAVLDVIAEEGLQENAARVGDRIRAGLAELSARHPLIGATYGTGLYQGIDLVSGVDGDRTPLAPDLVADVCDRLLELGCVVQPTGLLGNVLKIKPPLCLTETDADRFLAAVDQALGEQEELAALVEGPRGAPDVAG